MTRKRSRDTIARAAVSVAAAIASSTVFACARRADDGAAAERARAEIDSLGRAWEDAA